LHERPQDLGTDFTAARDDLERSLARLWQDQLGIAEVGVHDDFFELGGNSLIAVELLQQLRKTRDVEISLHTLFGAPNVAALAEEVRKAQSESGLELQRLEKLLDMMDETPQEDLNKMLASEEKPGTTKPLGQGH
jgi:acyl carrier protein